MSKLMKSFVDDFSRKKKRNDARFVGFGKNVKKKINSSDLPL